MYVIPAFYAAFVSDKHFEKKNHFETSKHKGEAANEK